MPALAAAYFQSARDPPLDAGASCGAPFAASGKTHVYPCPRTVRMYLPSSTSSRPFRSRNIVCVRLLSSTVVSGHRDAINSDLVTVRPAAPTRIPSKSKALSAERNQCRSAPQLPPVQVKHERPKPIFLGASLRCLRHGFNSKVALLFGQEPETVSDSFDKACDAN